MKIITAFILLYFVPCYALFAGKISGTVTDTNGKPLAYASVFVQGSNKGTSTNAVGHY